MWLHQDPDVAELAALYIQVSWLQVIPFGIVSILRKFLQNQNIVNPLIISGFINIVLTTISIIIMLYVFEWGFVSLPLNMLFCNILSITYLSIVILYKKLWQKTYSPFTWNTFKGLPEFYKLAIPGMLMGCAEWWSYEIHVLVAGTISVASLAAMSLLYTGLSLFYTFPLCMSITVSIKVGNAVGECDAKKAISYTRITEIVGVALQSILMTGLYLTSEKWPLLFTNDQEVLDILSGVMLLVCVFEAMDTAQNIMGGVLRGAGKQKIGAIAYITLFYLIAIPLGIILAIKYDMGIKGQWIGIMVGCTLILIVMLIYYFCIMNWDNIIEESQKRIQELETLQLESDTNEDTTDLENNEIEMETIEDEEPIEI